MATYFSPGVYVEEVPSAVQPIAGVGTNTAGFIGVITRDVIDIPIPNENYDPTQDDEDAEQVDPIAEKLVGKTLGDVVVVNLEKTLPKGHVLSEPEAEALQGSPVILIVRQGVDDALQNKTLAETVTDPNGLPLTVELVDMTVTLEEGYKIVSGQVEDIRTALKEQAKRELILVEDTVDLSPADAWKEVVGKSLARETKVTMRTSLRAGTLITEELVGPIVAEDNPVPIKKNLPYKLQPFTVKAKNEEPELVTNFSEFINLFGYFSNDPGQNTLAHAVQGFFINGGTRCFVMRVRSEAAISNQLLEDTFADIDEIALVAAPGVVDRAAVSAIDAHCRAINRQDRFAIFDCPLEVDLKELDPKDANSILPDNSDYAAYYFPWIEVSDPASKRMNPKSKEPVYKPPSGHMAGIYARVDTTRGVHKAPANEPVIGALGLKYLIGRAKQNGLNPQGVNCIRDINGNINVWGARTLGGDANGEWKYINVRRLFLFLRESIDEGTQWVVFEPNSHELWAKIRRNITAFLTTVWSDGALFGLTPEEAFYVKCDEETNPPEIRDLGQVITEIGVAVVKPAEFVVFRISQWAGPGN